MKGPTRDEQVRSFCDPATVTTLCQCSLISGQKKKKHTTGGIPRWSPTLVLVARFSAYVWQSGRDAQFSLTYGRMCLLKIKFAL